MEFKFFPRICKNYIQLIFSGVTNFFVKLINSSYPYSRNSKILNQSIGSIGSFDINVSKKIYLFPNKDNQIRTMEENDVKILESGYRISPWIITNIMKIKEKEFKNATSKTVSKEETQYFKLNQDINGLKKDFAIMSVNINKYLNKRTV